MQTLERFPTKIEDVYAQTWGRILDQDPEHVSLTKIVMAWVLHARRSLTMEELCSAIATCPDTHRFERQRIVQEATLTDLCHGLLSVDEKSRFVRLVRKLIGALSSTHSLTDR